MGTGRATVSAVRLVSANGTIGVALHDSLWRGLVEVTALGNVRDLGQRDAVTLDHWADALCDNPTGQRADLARSIAGLIRVSGGLTVVRLSGDPSGDFWSSVSQ